MSFPSSESGRASRDGGLNEKEQDETFASCHSLYATLFWCGQSRGERSRMTVPPTSVQVETGHQDMIVRRLLHVKPTPHSSQLTSLLAWAVQHDAQLDYYGRKLATASSDRTIRVFDVEQDDSYKLVDTLQGSVRPQRETIRTGQLTDTHTRSQARRTGARSRVGSPFVRLHPRLVLVRRQGLYLEGERRSPEGLESSQGALAPHGER